MRPVLLIDFGSTYTKTTAVDLDSEAVLGTSRALTTAGEDINLGLENAFRELLQHTGKLNFEARLACSSAAGGLRMVTVGLVPELTAQAGRMAALNAGAKVLKTFSYELNKEELDEIEGLLPDIILLCGGTDGGNKNVLLHNARALSGVGGGFVTVVAGNKEAAGMAAAEIGRSGKEAVVCSNVMPQFGRLDIEPARDAIREIFLKRIIAAKGLSRAQQLLNDIVMPTPSAVMKAAANLDESGFAGKGGLVVVDVGGATTDVHSICSGAPTKGGVIQKGLPEPYAKRTVEGDLGVRHGARFIAEAAGIQCIASKSGLSTAETEEYVGLAAAKPGLVPDCDSKVEALDRGLARAAVKLAVERHAGRVETCYTPAGVMFLQSGKDLGGVSLVIGTGGPLVNSRNPREILAEVTGSEDEADVLKPVKPRLMLDAKYITAAMGLLAAHYPLQAARILQKELKYVGG